MIKFSSSFFQSAGHLYTNLTNCIEFWMFEIPFLYQNRTFSDISNNVYTNHLQLYSPALFRILAPKAISIILVLVPRNACLSSQWRNFVGRHLAFVLMTVQVQTDEQPIMWAVCEAVCDWSVFGHPPLTVG